MSLFNECKEALSDDFNVLEGQSEKEIINILYQFPLSNGNILWEELEYADFEDINAFIAASQKNECVYIFADDIDVPVFKTNLFLVAQNIYDVTALSPRLFIFNDKFILQPLFPTEIIRVGIKK
ncbi:hypothetical protein HS962_06085 [Pantoea sp. BIGb0393]|uniref:Uncharacterized protein n=1 Tax=Pantoea nemavictus TaxID=2726955 RepID=A0ABU8PPZ1_9GAMM|nr:hypothetical protein [Pantoea nemavictus]MBA0035799.1 hypothetical protein [Pantoea nemavictus]